MIQDFETLINMANENVLRAGDTDPEYALIHSNLAIAFAAIAIAQELKKFNDAADLERERAERKLERKDNWISTGVEKGNEP